MKCPLCKDCFDDLFRIPYIGKCGHSVCEPCVQLLVNARTRSGTACPDCKMVDAFSNLERNDAMIDSLVATEAVRKEKAQAEQAQVDHETSLVCHSCSAQIELEKGRICQPCSEANGCIQTDADGSVMVNNAVQLEASVLCGNCLSGFHRGHKTLLMWPLKTSFVAYDSGNDLSDRIVEAEAAFEAEIDNLLVPVDTFMQPLLKIREVAGSAGPMEELNQIVEKCEKEFEVLDVAEVARHNRHNARFIQLKEQIFDNRMEEMLKCVRKAADRTSQSDGTRSAASSDEREVPPYPEVTADNVWARLRLMNLGPKYDIVWPDEVNYRPRNRSKD